MNYDGLTIHSLETLIENGALRLESLQSERERIDNAIRHAEQKLDELKTARRKKLEAME